MNPNENNLNQKTGGVGSAIAVIIIVAVLAFGGYYFWSQVNEKAAYKNANTVNPELQSTSTSGINTELEADLNTMQNDDLGQSDMQSIDSEFNQ